LVAIELKQIEASVAAELFNSSEASRCSCCVVLLQVAAARLKLHLNSFGVNFMLQGNFTLFQVKLV
jgi:hypothetical protein